MKAQFNLNQVVSRRQFGKFATTGVVAVLFKQIIQGSPLMTTKPDFIRRFNHPIVTKPAQEPKLFGTTFSPRDLAYRAWKFKNPEIGKWRDALDAMDELGDDFNFLRIGAYWNQVEQSKNHYDWEELDQLIAAIEQKQKYGVLLTVGMKAPRWPEYYIPDWVLPKSPGKNAEISKNQILRERTKKFIIKVVERYKDRDVIKAWQLENEPMDRSGENRWFIGSDFIESEAHEIRSIDNRPIVINCWCEKQTIGSDPWSDDEYAVRNAIAIGNILGLDIYIAINGDNSDYKRRTIELPKKYMERATASGKKAWVIESQAEPWGESHNLSLGDVQWLVDQHIEQGFQCILLWGFEWWWEMRFLDPVRAKEWFNHIRWEAWRFKRGVLSPEKSLR